MDEDDVYEPDVERFGFLQMILDECIQNFGGKAFVKLNTRSPKDVVYYEKNYEKKKILLLQELSKFNNYLQDPLMQRNLDIISFIHASNQSLAVDFGVEALDLLFKNSTRVNGDIMRTLEYYTESVTDENGDDFYFSKEGVDFPLKIVVRKWYDIHPEQEFRAFVYNGNLTAISQYYHFCYFPNLVEKKDDIKEQIINFFELEVKNNLHVDTCIIDFAILSDKPYVIELNNFHQTTDSCLFSWHDETDLKLLMEGPVTIRVLETLNIQAAEEQLVPFWREFIDSWKKENS